MKSKLFFMLLGVSLLFGTSFAQAPNWVPGSGGGTTTNYYLSGTNGNVCLGMLNTQANTSYKLWGVGPCKFSTGVLAQGTGSVILNPTESGSSPTTIELCTGGTNGNLTTQIDFKGQLHWSSDFWGRIKHSDGTGFSFQTGGVGTDRVLITEAGAVGIGIVPTMFIQLQVEGIASKFSSGSGYIAFTHNSAQMDLVSTGVPTIDFKGPTHTGSDYWGRIMYADGTGFDFLTAGGTAKMRIKEDGKVVIGDPSAVQTTTPASLSDYKLFVDGGIIAEKVKVALCCGVDWSDFVFAPDYQLLSLDSVDTYIQKNQHLPGVPSSEEVQENGIEVAKMDALLLQKIEELTLYMIELKKQNEVLQKEIQILKDETND